MKKTAEHRKIIGLLAIAFKNIFSPKEIVWEGNIATKTFTIKNCYL